LDLSFDFSKINHDNSLENISQYVLQSSQFKNANTLINRKNVMVYKLPTKLLNNNKESK